MSKPRYDWWSYAIRIAEKWTELRDEYEDLHTQSLTANISGMPSCRNASRAVENVALRSLPKNRQKEYDAAMFAIKEIMRKPDADRKMEIIKLRYWDKTMTTAGAGMKVGYAERSARRTCWRYILAIGRGMEFISEEEYIKALRRDNN